MSTRSKEWRRLRLNVLDSQGWRCFYCGRDLHEPFNAYVHHDYEWIETDETIERRIKGYYAVCPKCNEVLHFGLLGSDEVYEYMVTVNEKRGISREESKRLFDEAWETWVRMCRLKPIYGEADKVVEKPIRNLKAKIEDALAELDDACK